MRQTTIDNKTLLPFGKYKDWAIGSVPSPYLRWLLEQDWFEGKYPELITVLDEELAWRDRYNCHVYEN